MHTFTSKSRGPEAIQKNTEVVLSDPALFAGGDLHFYTDSVWTKLDRQTGNETFIEGPADQGQHCSVLIPYGGSNFSSIILVPPADRVKRKKVV